MMQIHRSIRKGEGHPVFCEDFQLLEYINEDLMVAAVFDGCSSGKESHFSSALFGKIIRKTIKTLPQLKKVDPGFDLENISPEGLGTYLAENLFNNVLKINNYLLLEYTEILSTVYLLVYQQTTKDAWILASGDGYVAINGNINSIDQQNRPDYLTYHLNEHFDNWFKNHVEIFNEKEVNAVAISTDGIGSFYNPSRMHKISENLTKALLTDTLDSTLDKKINGWKDTQGLVHYDDISIIRIENE